MKTYLMPKLVASILLCLSLQVSWSQVLDVQVNLVPPYQTNLDAYVDQLELGVLTITNNTNNPIDAFFEASLVEVNGLLSVRTDGIQGQSITVNAGLNVLDASNIEDIFSGLSENNIVTTGLSPDQRDAIYLNRQLPEGTYRLCVQAFDGQGQPLSDLSMGGCFEFDILYPERPVILNPFADQVVDTSGFVNVTWDHVLNSNDAINRTEYVVKIIDLTEQEIENSALAMFNPGVSPEYEEEQGNKLNVVLQDDIDLPFIAGHTYAIRVTAFDPDEKIAYQFGGHSEIVQFTYGEAPSSDTDVTPTDKVFNLPAPVVMTPNSDYVNPNGQLRIAWEHEINDTTINVDSFKYAIKILDLDTNKITSVTLKDFNNDKNIFYVNGPIAQQDTTFRDNANLKLAKDHKYAVVVQAEAEVDDRIKFGNEGFSEIVTFIYGAEQAPDSSGCGGDCRAELPTNQVEASISKKASLFLGKLLLTVTDRVVDNANGGYKGTGYVTLKFMGGVKVKVEFSGLKANKEKYVFDGSVKAIYDSNFPKLDGLTAMAASTATNLDFETAKTVSSLIRSGGKVASALAGKQTALPLGFDKVIDGDTMIIGITDIQISPQKAVMSAMFTLKNPDWGDNVPSLAASNICFTKDGFGSDIRMILHEDYEIPLTDGIITLKAADNENPENLGTFIEVDCDGFKQGQLTGEIAIPRKILLPEKEDGKIADGNAKLTISGTFDNLSNFLLSASVTPCQIPGLEGFSFEMKNGFYDHSDLSNPEALKFPQGYSRAETDDTWRGVWFESVQIKAPTDWQLAGADARTGFQIANFIKDDVGISVNASVNNILGIDKGSLEGFAVSIDALRLNILRGQFKEVKLEGRLGMPILPEDKYLSYEGIVDREGKKQSNTNTKKTSGTTNTTKTTGSKEPLSMSFVVKPDKEGYDIDWLKAHIDFEESSQFILKNNAEERGFKATLSGSITLSSSVDKINAERDSGTPEIDIPGLKFEGMEISRMIPKNPNAGTTTKTGPKQKPNSSKNNTGGFVFKRPTFSFLGFAVKDITGNSNQTAGNPASPQNPTPPTANNTTQTPTEEPVDPKLNAFSISIDEIGFTFGDGDSSEEKEIVDGTQVNLKVVPMVMLVGGEKTKTSNGKTRKEEGFSISAKGSFTISANVKKPAGSSGMSFAYKSIGIDSFRVFGEVGPMSIDGAAEFYNKDKVFGNGMAGELAVKMPMIDIKLEARFGNTLDGKGDIDYAYWYLFGNLLNKAPTGLAKIGPYFTLHGFNGGAYYHMKDANPLEITAAKRYVPDNTTSLGVKAGISFDITDAKVMWANTTFGIAFNEKYGVKEISLDGKAYMLQPEMKMVSGNEIEGIMAQLNAKVNFKKAEKGQREIEFDAQAALYANLVDGMLVGAMDAAKPYLVVNSTMHIDSKKWSMYMGKPSEPGKVRLAIPGLEELGSASYTAYLMMGKDVTFEDAQLPPFINNLLGRSNKGFDPANAATSAESTRKGNGFAMGLNIDYQMNLEASILYAKFRAMFGFDLMMRDYPGVVCSNNDNSVIGINGYYANGQVFAGLSGDIGLDVDVFFYKGKLSLAKLQAALLLEGGLPNPIWVRGTARMSYSVLGGLIEGSTGFTVQMGDQCEKQKSDPFSGVEVISDIDPGNTQNQPLMTNVSVFAKPRLSLNMNLGQHSIPFSDLSGARTRVFDLRIDEFKLTKSSNGAVVNCRRVDESSNRLQLDPTEMLDPQAEYTITAKLSAYEKINGQWQPFKKGDEIWTEVATRKFRTGNRPNHIVWENVTLTYPFNYEDAYLHGENKYKEGFLQFNVPTDYLFKPEIPVDQQWHSKIVIKWYQKKHSSWNKHLATTQITHGKGKYLVFEMPDQLPKNADIICVVVRAYYKNPKWDDSAQDRGPIARAGGEYKIMVQGQEFRNYTSDKPNDKEVFHYEFHTSKFNTFKEKVNSGRNRLIVENKYNTGVHSYGRILKYKLGGGEKFSVEEVGERRLLASGSTNNAMITYEEKYDSKKYGSDFYSDVFDFFDFQRFVFDFIRSTMIAEEYASFRFTYAQTYANWSGNLKRSIDYYEFKSSDQRLGFKFDRVSPIKLDNDYWKGGFDLNSKVCALADYDVLRTNDFADAVLLIGASKAIFDPVKYTNKMSELWDSKFQLRAKPKRGKYYLEIRYYTPYVSNGAYGTKLRERYSEHLVEFIY